MVVVVVVVLVLVVVVLVVVVASAPMEGTTKIMHCNGMKAVIHLKSVFLFGVRQWAIV